MKRRDVFINCPFSEDYQDKFRAIVFVILRSGLNPRCALETDDNADNRFDKICEIVRQSRFGVHDISKTELDKGSRLPRFNMPLELGIFLAARKFGDQNQRKKSCIIFDKSKYRYQQFMSDISGQDIHSHENDLKTLIKELSAWLRSVLPNQLIPGGQAVASEYKLFLKAIPQICKDMELATKEITFQDYRKMASEWIGATAK